MPDAARRERAAQIAHEIKNVVAAIRINATVVRGTLGSSSQAPIDDIELACAQLERLLGELLDEAGSDMMGEVDLSTLVWQVGSVDLPAVATRDLSIDLQIGDDCKVMGNARDLKRAVVCLAQNAVQSGARSVTLGVRRQGPQIVVNIDDDGRGIRDDLLDRVREPGFTTRAKGTGLGLSVVARIVAAHRGRMDIDSAVGRGTTVRLMLPMAD